jgi:hypothetical protein
MAKALLLILVAGSLPVLAENKNQAQDYCTKIKPYAVSVTPDYALQPLISVGDRIPETGAPGSQYQLVGLPEGLGAHRSTNNTTVLYMSHGLDQAAQSEPLVGRPLNRGAFVSKLILNNRTGCLFSGDRAYDTVFNENTPVGAAPEVGNATPAFARFSSGSLNEQKSVFDRPIYLTGEDRDGTASFDSLGGLLVAIFDNELHTLPKFGHLSWKNAVVRPKPGRDTVVVCLESGPTTPDSQLYLYAGTKDTAAGTTALRRNGLDNGKLYVLVPVNTAQADETVVTTGTVACHWVEIPGADLLSETQLEAAADAAGAFGFIRLGDGAFDKKDPGRFYFVTTGGASGNLLGRVYELQFNQAQVLGPCTLRVVVNADTVAAADGDTAFSPDDVDTSDRYLFVCEDGNDQSQPEYTARAREGSVWRFDLWNDFEAERVAELNPPGIDTNPVLVPGTWETTGILDARNFFGSDSALFNVQAHDPTTAPAANTVEDGQLLLMRSSRPGRSGDSHKGN